MNLPEYLKDRALVYLGRILCMLLAGADGCM